MLSDYIFIVIYTPYLIVKVYQKTTLIFISQHAF